MASKTLTSVQLLFRSAITRNLHKSYSTIKMTSVEELKLKSKEANELIQSLKNQIEQIKLSSTPAYMAEKAKSLETENSQLKLKVEELKKQLEQAEALKGTSTPVFSTAAPVAAVPVVASTEPQTQAPKAKEAPTGFKTEKAPKQPKTAPVKKEELAPEDVNVSKLDMRIGKIIKCEKHPEAESLYVEQIDLGEAKPRNVCSGLVKFIPLENMQDRLVVCVCNLKPAKLRGILSEAMVLCASTPEKVELMLAPPGAQIGDRVIVEEFAGEPAAECNTKNKIWDLVHVDLKTNDDLVGTYKGKPMVIKGKGPIKSETLKNVPVK